MDTAHRCSTTARHAVAEVKKGVPDARVRDLARAHVQRRQPPVRLSGAQVDDAAQDPGPPRVTAGRHRGVRHGQHPT
ncbi:hypothetical protein [Corallococcus sp. 4LFB]|uniref:hypothetical protein n=1 Tax=Corallococcus sp. 4LFB TaxID=3383249 RepID=UPI003975406E